MLVESELLYSLSVGKLQLEKQNKMNGKKNTTSPITALSPYPWFNLVDIWGRQHHWYGLMESAICLFNVTSISAALKERKQKKKFPKSPVCKNEDQLLGDSYYISSC